MPSVRTPDPNPGWLSEFALDETRSRVPILYVEAVPVRVDGLGRIEHVGLLLRGSSSGGLSRITGVWPRPVRRVGARGIDAQSGEGPRTSGLSAASGLDDPRGRRRVLPASRRRALHDPRQHAVSLVYVVPVTGDCAPRQDALELTWLTPFEAVAPEVIDDLEGGRGSLLRQALAHAGALDA